MIGFMSCENVKGPKPPKYVFMLIGDGMGINHLYLANEFAKQTGKPQLNILNFPYFALTTTHPLDTGRITDSAEAGTAIACGRKTRNRAVGMNPDTGEKFVSIAEILHQNDFKIGLITSVGINDATPAVFYGHQKSRRMYSELVEDMVASNFEYFAGGGIISSNKDNPIEARKTIFSKIKDADYTIVADRNRAKEIQNLGKIFVCDTTKKLGSALPNIIDSIDVQFSLSEMLKLGIEKLFSEKGFFIMLESGKIDWLSHDNDAASVIHEVLDFDKSVKIALDFYKKHPNETLIIVTTDHETGGMSWGNNITNYDNYTYKLQQQKKSVYLIKDSLASMQNAEKQEFIRKNLGFEINIEEYTQNMQLKNAANSASAMHSKKENYQFSVAELANHLIDSLNTSAGISWATHAHSGSPVGTFAIGVGAHEFHGQIDNTEIKPILLKILEL